MIARIIGYRGKFLPQIKKSWFFGWWQDLNICDDIDEAKREIKFQVSERKNDDKVFWSGKVCEL